MTSPNSRQDSGRTIIPAVRASNHWQDRAACKTADAEAIFFPVSPNAATIQAAKEICYGCPVIEDCKRFALERREPYGVWGGMSEYERRVVGTQKEPRPQKILRTQRAEWDAAVATYGNNDKAIAQALGTDTRTVWKVQRLLLDDTQALDEAADELPATSSATAYSESIVARFLAGESVVLGQTERRMVVAHFMEWSSMSPEQIAERLDTTVGAVRKQWERVQARARREGRPVPVRRVPREERSELKQIQMGEAA
ncbi:WhiB family transcriptional regulator [Streptomyces albidoflavus]|uniref:WhiB family transcriptional regulator n=1 Tax=Streptomyces albidoflavus TaxID=1886 RepID=UPI00068E1C9F|nr:WhiB family transcriptional regulator [Streptomyces albidoflavus]